MVTTRDERSAQREDGINWPLWFGVLGGPIAWSIHLIVSSSLVLPVCQRGGVIALHAISFGLTLVAAAAAIAAWRQWRTVREPVDVAMHGTGSRIGFMALYGMLSGALFAVAILVAWTPIFFIDPCLEA